MNTTEDLTQTEAKELAQRLGIFWHGWKDNYDFYNPIVVIQLARQREDWPEFFEYLLTRYCPRLSRKPDVMALQSQAFAEIEDLLKLILNHTGKLGKLLLLWLRGKEKYNGK